jgi:hypothetical protein
MIQSRIEVGALLQVLWGVTLGRADFFVCDVDTGTGGQCNSSGDGRRGDDGEDIEVHGVYLGVDVSFQVLTVLAVELKVRPRSFQKKSFLALAHITSINTWLQPLVFKG